MSAKALLRALAALAGLVFVWGAFALFRGSVSDAPSRLVLPPLTQADVDRIAITQGADTVVLARGESGWRVNGRPADREQVDQVFRALVDSAAGSELLARSASSHGRLGVDSTGRIAVFSHAGDTLLALVLGAQGPAYQTAYVRRAGDGEVFLYRGTLPGLLGREPDTWRDRRIARIPADTVGEVHIVRGTHVATLTRSGDGWVTGAGPADSAAVARLLRALADVSAIGFAPAAKADSLDFMRPDRRLAVLDRAGDTLLALAIDSTADGYWVRAGSGGEAFQLDFWRLNELTPPDSVLSRRRS